MRKILTLLFTLFFGLETLNAQTTKPVTGLSDERSIPIAFRNATLIVDAKTVIKGATLLIRKDKIIAAGTGVTIPADAVVYDLKDRYVYPSFIDPFTDYGQPESKPPTRANRRERGAQVESATPGAYHWNQAIRSETEAYMYFTVDEKRAMELRKLGFGTALSLQKDGIARGTAALVLLGEEEERAMILKDKVANALSFNKGSSTQDYPSSLMGSIALLRQTYLDAQWYAQTTNREMDISLAAWNANKGLPQIFEVGDYRSALRADRIAKEFGVNYILKGGGDEYKRVEEIRKTGSSFIIPLNFPKAYDITNPFDALNVSLGEMRHWEMAPANAVMLHNAGVRFAFTTDGLKEKKEFSAALIKAIKCGLSKEAALSALTTVPASLLGCTDKLGALRSGMIANFFICTKDYFEKDNVVLENWVAGKRYVIKTSDSIDIRGNYSLKLDTLNNWNLKAAGDMNAPEWTLQRDSTKVKVESQLFSSQWTFRFEPVKGKGAYRLNGSLDSSFNSISGQAQTPDGRWLLWTATKTGPAEAKKDTTKKDSLFVLPQVWYPNMSYGWRGKENFPKASTVLIRNATVWTCEEQGVLQNTDVLIRDGKIAMIGKAAADVSKGLSAADIIDGTGMHLSPGIIDEHSHIAINDGVNEGTQSITSEVRIGDVVNPDDINIYRQLSGGVTTSHLLHGSANAIGGQSALIKLRWGHAAEEMKFKGADGFIKFALGENVKQSNWGDNNVSRYPQTRMGVEQIYMDGFTRAREYDNSYSKFKPASGKSISPMPRRDLELEALAEILNKKRFITCHSYQQGEINMLMHVADTFGFTVNTFTHILEGYKVADKMKQHGAGGSSFADWWAYKYEVIEAIPYNGALMHKNGVFTAFNSDDAEMARRLNQEAAKAVKYGGITPEEALKFVTLNPAKLLHVDKSVGSIKVGKDADIVLWNGPPLSVYSKPVKTFIDGVCYYDLKKDQEARIAIEAERQRLIKKMMDEKSSGGAMQKPTATLQELYHCNDMEHLPHE
ncbi:MAG: amidohydrolase family protein [Bacteroidetes bacterium]|nr:amidohydrolase family protein [Bacteroidota bacterium]